MKSKLQAIKLTLVYQHHQRRDERNAAPQFTALLGQVENGEMLMVVKLDRLGRDAQDGGPTFKLLASRKIAVIVQQLGKSDLTSPTVR